MKKIGREVLFLEAKGNIPRNGEGSFIRLNDGRIMFAYTEFVGNDWEDDATANISVIYSSDEGETWTTPQILFRKPEEAWNIMSFSFLRMGNGDIGAFYIVKNADRTDKIVLTRSADEGETWSEPMNCLDCLDVADYYVINNDRVVRLKNGRIILPTARHTVINAPLDFMPGVICFFYSDDDGYTWQKVETELPCPFTNNPDGYEEPGIYEKADGTLWCYIRTSLGFQFECFSNDNGTTWTTPEPNIFFSSACSPMLVKDCGKLTVAVFNPVPEHLLREESEPWGRTPYVIAVSTDRGLSFSKENVFYIEDDLTNGYCYPAIIECADGFLVAYYHSNGTDVCLNSTKIIKINYKEVLFGLRKTLIGSYLGKTVTIKIDRPMGYVHQKENFSLSYPINYGYIPDVFSADGEELDVYLLGVNEPVNEYTAKVVAIVHRHNDVEDKLVAVPEGKLYTKEEIEKEVYFQEQYYETEIEVLK